MTPDDVKAIRARLGLTQAQLAAELGVARHSLNRWEMPPSNPNARPIPAWAARFLAHLAHHHPTEPTQP